MTKYIIVGFNTENYAPEEIATVSQLFGSFDDALKELKVFIEEDGCFEGCELDEDEGCIVTKEGHRGYYIQGVINA